MSTCRSRKLAPQVDPRLEHISDRTDKKSAAKLGSSKNKQYQKEMSVYEVTQQTLTYQRSFFSYNYNFFEKLQLTRIFRKISTSCVKQYTRPQQTNKQTRPQQTNKQTRPQQTNKQTRHQQKQKPPGNPQKPKPKVGNPEHIIPERPKLSLDVIQKFSDNFCANINGNLDKTESKELNGGARIHKVFMDTNKILEKIDPLAGLTKEEILIVILNAHGICMSRYIPKEAFEFLLKKQIEQLRMPCLNSVDRVYSELKNIINVILKDSKLNLDSDMQEEMSGVALGLLNRHVETTKTMVNNILNINSAYINFSDPRFLDIQDQSPGYRLVERCDSSNSIYLMFKKKLELYFLKVKRNVKDMLPKIIIYFLVNIVMKELYLELVSRRKDSEKSDLKPLEWKCNDESTLERTDTIVDSPEYTDPTLTKTTCSYKTEQIWQEKRWLIKYLISLFIFIYLLFMVISYFY